MMDQLYINGEHAQRDVIMLAAALFAEDGQVVLASCLLVHCIYIDPIYLFAAPCVLGLAQARVSATGKTMPSSWSRFVAKWFTWLMGILSAAQVSHGMYFTLLNLLSSLTPLRVVGWMQWSLQAAMRSDDWAGYVEMLCDAWLGFVATAVGTVYRTFVPSRDPDHYSASLGVRWYLDAQMLPEYRVYFDGLLAAQPLVCAIFVHARIAPRNPSVAVHVMMAIVILFSRDLAAADVLLAVGLLAQHTTVANQMRQLPWIVTGIQLPLVLTPVMLTMWIEYGTGNANYCFFQGICLWLFFALGVGEFCIAFMKVSTLAIPR
ncbi:GPI transamidase subunit PIG-U [Ochromonadaceae sp. CCMP2298]|nr:GPI transamidase subunit PIG-U [Ochromonadaceae sp. CCMP2298]